MISSFAEPDNSVRGGCSGTPAPVRLKRLDGVDLSARYHSDRWGGDFFDAVSADSRVIFLLTDIAGTREEAHSIAAEMQVVFRQRSVASFDLPEANEAEALATITHAVNRALMEAADGTCYAPTFLGCFNRVLGVLTYCNAGHASATFRDARSVRPLGLSGMPLGLFSHVTYEPSVLAFEPNDTLLLVTKGVVESRRGATEFGSKRVERILEQSNGETASGLCDTILREAHEFSSHPWSRICDLVHARRPRDRDDMTAVAVVRTAP